ncbi:MAG: DNA polymerase IV [Bacteroidetes bacterium]|nr:DNA polymerase IV [Bacteroidota bacterium]
MEHRNTYIAHLDLDCFFVSVERIKNPALIGKPVVVAGVPQERGVVASASYEARMYGIHSAMPTAHALKLCPSLIVVQPHHHEYIQISDRIFQRLCDFAPSVERASIDEMNMDFTGCEQLYNNDFHNFLKSLQRLIALEFKLPSTIALSSNATVSKIAANLVKPNGLYIVPHGYEAEFLAPININVIPGVGKKTEEILCRAGFRTIADIQRSSLQQLTMLLGKHGLWIYNAAFGKGPTTLSAPSIPKSISREETFVKDLHTINEAKRSLFELVESCCSHLREQQLKARTITLKLRYSNFSTVTRSHTVLPTDEDPIVFSIAFDLLIKSWVPQKPLRLLGVRLSNLDGSDQLPLFFFNEKTTKILTALDELRRKYGNNIIHFGSVE